MSRFSELLEEEGLDPTDLEPDELRFLCRDPVFRYVAKWCLERHEASLEQLEQLEQGYDPDELGIDPEDDAERFTDQE